MARIDISETIKQIDFPKEIWEWLDLFGDIVAATQSEAVYQDIGFVAETPFKKTSALYNQQGYINIKYNIFHSPLRINPSSIFACSSFL